MVITFNDLPVKLRLYEPKDESGVFMIIFNITDIYDLSKISPLLQEMAKAAYIIFYESNLN